MPETAGSRELEDVDDAELQKVLGTMEGGRLWVDAATAMMDWHGGARRRQQQQQQQTTSGHI